MVEYTTYVADSERPHLGGSLPGGDPQSFSPSLWEDLVEGGVRSMIDVGCGDGAAVRWFKQHGVYDSLGIDGLRPEGLGTEKWFIEHDYAKGHFPSRSPGKFWKSVDLVWSCEFVEHVEERFVPNFLETFKLGKLVLMTHGLPGQLGWHHVNCRSADYWVGAMAAAGYRLDSDLTEKCRSLAGEGYFARTGLAFRSVV